ncbi:hypothetical protein K6U06_21940 [Acidiferrimicrobium sp. IK]|uniref:hypothetical protein n=1 Tax=Acidiferrimicrobium sp. IK TaxID=2871700 RepID=UPI0021CB27DA|nr:hypothetical protein [Acidiferrimicrobium sp. IK]MCU4187042.1 hypothetical protein [Acidiferrimicrobium sp. IK]
MSTAEELVERYIRLGLAVGRHIDGMVDAYYGPPEIAAQAAAGAPESPAALVGQASRLVADLRGDRSLDGPRRRWLEAQARGVHTTARILAGEPLGYLDEVEAAYGVRPRYVEEDELAAAHRRLDAALPGTGAVAERYVAWREAQVVPAERLQQAVVSLAEDFRERTDRLFGLPEGEHVDFELVTGQPWSGFNYYLGGLRSRVAINTDLPVLSTSLGHLVAHEAYPGHHTEHTRKEVGLVRGRHQLEESVFLVGTPQCLLAEGLADLGLEVIAGRRPEAVLAAHLHPLGIPYDADTVAEVGEAGEVLGAVRGNAAIMLHDRGTTADEASDYIARWSLTTKARADKAVEFLMDPTWRAYVYCYIEGVALCRRFVAGDPARFARLISEQLIPADLTA